MINKKADTRLLTGIAIMLFGTLAAAFLGAGIALNNSTLSWIGGIIMACEGLILAIIGKFLQ